VSEESDTYLEQARDLLDEGRHRRAYEVVRDALKARDDMPLDGHLLLGRALLEGGRLRACTREMARLLTAYPKNIDAMKLLGRALLEHGKAEEAWVVLKRARETAPDDAGIGALLIRAAGVVRHSRVDLVVADLSAGADPLDPDSGQAARRPAAFTGYIRAIAARPGSDAFHPEEASVVIDLDYQEELDDQRHHVGATPTPATPTPTPTQESPDQIATYDDAHPVTGSGTREALSPGLHPPPMETEVEEAAAGPAASDEFDVPPTVESAGASPVMDATRPIPPPPGRNPYDPDEEEDDTEAVQLPTLDDDTESPTPGRPVGQDVDSIGWPMAATPPEEEAGLVTERSIIEDRDALNQPPPIEDRSHDEPLLEETRELDDLARDMDYIGEPPTHPDDTDAGLDIDGVMSSAAPDTGAIVESSLDLPRLSWETAEPDDEHADRPGTVALPRRRPGGASQPPPPPAKPPTSRPPPLPEPVSEIIAIPSRPSTPPPPAAPAPVAKPTADERPSARAEPEPLDLLEIPLDPAEFADMPPKPTPIATHAPPTDMSGTSGPLPPRRRRRETSNPGTGEMPATGPLPLHSSLLHEAPPAPPPPVPAPRPKPVPRAEPTPVYEGELASFADAGASDVLGQVVGEARSKNYGPGPRPAEAAATLKPADADDGGPSATVRIATLAVVVAVLVLALVSTWSYRSAVSEADALIEDARRAVADGNYGSRLEVTERLAGAPEPGGPLVWLGDTVASSAGGGLEGHRATRLALLARLEAERVHLFGERGRLDAARVAERAARDAAPKSTDTAAARVLLALHAGRPADARRAIEELPSTARKQARAQLMLARTLLASGDRDAAVDRARTATRLDDGLLPARKLLADLKAAKGDYTGALKDYEALLDAAADEHIDTQVALQRLRVQVNKRAGEALDGLKRLLEGGDSVLAPTQRARIHDSIGLYYARRGEFPSARDAYRAAIDAAPDDPRYSTGLARLDMRAFKLDEAEAVLRRASEAEPRAPEHRVALARVSLLRGDADGVLAQIKRIRKPGAEALLLQAQAELALGDPRAAEETLREASRLDSGLTDIRLYRTLAQFLLGRQPDATLAQLRAGRERSGVADQRLEDRTLPFRAYGIALARKREFKSAVSEFERALVIERTDFRAHHELCRLFAERRDARRALRQCRAALSTNPHFAPAAVLSAEIAERWRDPGAVSASLAPLVANGRASAAGVRRLVRALVQQGQLEKATALATDDVDPATGRYIRGLVALARNETAAAREALLPVTDELTADPFAQVAYADALMKSDRAQEAATFYRRAIKTGDGPEGALGAARAALRRERAREAIAAAREAGRRATKGLYHPKVQAQALVLEAQGWMEKGGRAGRRSAQRALSKAQRLERDLPATLLAQGQLAEATGQRDDAIARYTRVTQVAPKHPEAFFRLGRLRLADPDDRDAAVQALRLAEKLDPEGAWGFRAKKLLER